MVCPEFSQADPEHFFPLLSPDLIPLFIEKTLPLIAPTMTTHAIIFLGKPGIGKKPLAIALSMAVARHSVSSRGLDVVVGWCRSKQIDGFRERSGEIHIPVLDRPILDDPNLSIIHMEDLKSFLDVGETSLVDARYRAAKFLRN